MTSAHRRGLQAIFPVLMLTGLAAWPVALAAQQAAPPAANPQAKQAPPKPVAKKPAAKPKQDPAAAQAEVEAGIAALGQGRNDAAVASLSGAITAGSLPPAQSARALYYRGVAHRRQAKPALAISDLTNALWIKNGLSEEQRADALQQRSAAYREAGLPDQGPPASATAQSAPKAGAQTALFGSVAPPAPAAPSNSITIGSGGGSLFSSIFGSSAASPSAAPKAQPAAAPVAAAIPSATARNAPAQVTSASVTPVPATGPQSTQQSTPATTGSVAVPRQTPQLPSGFQSYPGDSATFYQGPSRAERASQQAVQPSGVGAVVSKSWDSATEVKPAQGAKAKTAAKRTATGGVRVQVAAVRSAQEAQTVANRLKSGFARELAGRDPVVDQTSAGSLGAVFRVQVGPYASARDTEPLCARLKGEGLDCRIVPQ